ncbi:IS3 family transposase [Thioclava sp. SK-1]|uniref:IS3 family transposase n=1 Tax=Thioclava sp. SK-1 TaxID=1889770 RepID=UPI003513B518
MLTVHIVQMARQYESYGYRQITGLLIAGGWSVNHKRVERVWRREGLAAEKLQTRAGF